MPDYRERIRALRALGAEGSGATDHERKLANDKADELEAKYGELVNESSPFTDDTTTNESYYWQPPSYMWNPDGTFNPFARPWNYDERVRTGHGPNMSPPNNGDYRPKSEEEKKREREAWDQLWNLHRNQHMWNKPPADEDDLISDEYKSNDFDYDYEADDYKKDDDDY